MLDLGSFSGPPQVLSLALLYCKLDRRLGMRLTKVKIVSFSDPHMVHVLYRGYRNETRVETAVMLSDKEVPTPLLLKGHNFTIISLSCCPGISNPDNYHLWIPKGLEMIIEKHGGKPVRLPPNTVD